MQEHLDDFYEEVYEEMETFGKVELFKVLDNVGEHMLGNVYVKWEKEESAEKAQVRCSHTSGLDSSALVCTFTNRHLSPT